MINVWDVDFGSDKNNTLQAGDTLPAVFWTAVAARGDDVFMRSKSLGVWASMSWREAGVAVREVAAGLLELGVQPGQVVCTVSHTRAECIIADLAVLSIGAVSAAVSPGLTPDIACLFRHAGVVLAFLEDDEHLALLRSVLGQLPGGMKTVLFGGDSSGRPTAAMELGWQNLRLLGRKADADNPATLDCRLAALAPDAPAIVSYSAGTTAPPTCVQHSHHAVLATCRALNDRVPHKSRDSRLSFLSWARVNERLLSIYLPILAGVSVNFTEGLDTVPENLREVAPSIVSATPRQLERLRADVMVAVGEAGRLPRAAFQWALARGGEAAERVLSRQPVGLGLRAQCAIGRIFVLNNVRRFMGLDRCRHLIVVDSTLPVPLAAWYFAMGVPVVQTWGTTQALGLSTVNALPDFTSGSVGRSLAVNQVDVDTATGELLVRGENVSRWRAGRDGGIAPDAVRTGDLGQVGADGHVRILGRVCEQIRAATGANIPASQIQQMLRASPYVQDALAFGESRSFATAVILLARENVEHFARSTGISFSDFHGLTQAHEIRTLIQAQIDLVNARLDAAHRIRAFHLIETDLEPGDPEMTPTMLLRRWAIEPRYRRQIESMYL